MRTIKGRLLWAFLSIIAALSVASFIFFLINFNVVVQYRSLSDTMIAEYRLVDNTQTLIDAFNTRLQSAGTNASESQGRIDSAKAEIESHFLALDHAIVDMFSKSNYLGFKASVQKLTTHIDDSITRFEQGSIKDYFADFNEANKQYGFVRENGTALLFSQLKYSSSLRDAVNQTYLISIIFGLGALLFLILGSIFFVLRFANRFTKPLVSLTSASQQLAGGNMDVTIEQSIVAQRDEVGVLAQSFTTMATSLKDKIFQLNTAKENTEKEVVIRTKELADEKARLLASINALSFGFVLVDPDDKIVLKNPALQKILEMEQEPHAMADIAQVFKRADSKVDLDIAGSCQRCMELKEPVEFKEVPYGKKFLRVICVPIASGDATIGYIFLVEDITEAKVMERSREEFFAVASHELRTPLTAIRGNTDMILTMFADKIQDQEVREMLQDIEASSVRLITVVNDFLEVSRLEQGRMEIKKENFDLCEVVDRVSRDLRSMVEQKGLSLTYKDPQCSTSVAYGDKARVEQVLLNLLGNATKFTKQGGIVIEVEQKEKFFTVRVTDTGAGISEHNQTRLFRKFQQAGEDMLARDVSQSTGLGLYISRLIMQTMGGEVGLQKSELGKGSTFFFTLPVGV